MPRTMKKKQIFSPNWINLKAILDNHKKRKRKDGTSISCKYDGAKKKDEHEMPSNSIDLPSLKNENISNSLNSENVISSSLPNGVKNIVALDCEMVGGGIRGEEDILARVSLVNQMGDVLYDKYVFPKEKVKDYRTYISGIRPNDLKNGENFDVVQKEVNDLIKDCLVVGHGLSNDFKCLLLSPPHFMVRDTSKFKPFKRMFDGRTPSLKKLAAKILNVNIQDGEHDSVQDASAAMRIYLLHKEVFEQKYQKKLRRKKCYNRPT